MVMDPSPECSVVLTRVCLCLCFICLNTIFSQGKCLSRPESEGGGDECKTFELCSVFFLSLEPLICFLLAVTYNGAADELIHQKDMWLTTDDEGMF